ncbi:MAG: rhomboid family intramembrane serine protease [Planctomycetota bacterium]
MSDTPDAEPADEQAGARPQGAVERLEAAGATIDRLDEATLRAVESVHKALLGSGNVTYGGRAVDAENWPRLPVILDVDIPTRVSKDEEYWAVVPWSPAVMSSAEDYLQAVRATFRDVKPKRFILVTSDQMSAKDAGRLGEKLGVTLLAVHAETLAVAGVEQALERMARVTGEGGFAAHAELDVRRVIAGHNAELEKEDEFYDLLHAATPRTWVTPVILCLNLLVFIAMVATGADYLNPAAHNVFSWGGAYGPNVVSGEWWRLLTANYVHFGLLHLGFNMWCLWQVGRFTERLLGHWAFLPAYALSGIGGAIASIAHNPVGIGAGASGAVFGLFGCILGFMLVRRRAIPVRVFKPHVVSILAFLGYNIYFGLTVERIDNFAHGGGLAVGFLCGMLLSRRIPPPVGGTPRRRYLYALAVVALLIGGGAFAARRVPENAPLLAPAFGGPERVYNSYMASVVSPMVRYQQIALESSRLTKVLSGRRVLPTDALSFAAALARAARQNLRLVEDISSRNAEIAALHKELLAAAAAQAGALDALAGAIRSNRASEMAAAIQQLRAADEHFRKFIRAQQAFLQRHRLAPRGR